MNIGNNGVWIWAADQLQTLRTDGSVTFDNPAQIELSDQQVTLEPGIDLVFGASSSLTTTIFSSVADGQFGSIFAEGSVTVTPGATLVVQLDSGYNPTTLERYEVLDCGPAACAFFTNIDLPPRFQQVGIAGDVVVQFVPTSPPLLAHWSFDEAASGGGTGTVVDVNGGGYDGTIAGGAAYVPGLVGAGALSFDGVDDYVGFGLQPNLDLTGGDYTISFWLNYEQKMLPSGADNLGRIINMDDAGNTSGGYSIFTSPLCCRNTHNSGPANDTGGAFQTIEPGGWTHVALVYDESAATRTFYYDGVSQGPIATPAPLLSDGDDPLFIGTYNSLQQFYKGLLDEVKLFGGALDPSAVAELADLDVPTFTNASPLGSDWSDPSNWSTGVVPGVDDSVVIPAGTTALVDGFFDVGAVDVEGQLDIGGSNALNIAGGSDGSLPTIVRSTGVVNILSPGVLNSAADSIEVEAGGLLNVSSEGRLVFNGTSPQSVTGGGEFENAGFVTSENPTSLTIAETVGYIGSVRLPSPGDGWLGRLRPGNARLHRPRRRARHGPLTECASGGDARRPHDLRHAPGRRFGNLQRCRSGDRRHAGR